MHHELSKKYDVSLTNMRNSKIIFHRLNKKYTDEDRIEELRSQNDRIIEETL